MLPVVAPAAARPGPRREHLAVPRGLRATTVGLVRPGALGGDVLGPAHLPGQRAVGVLPAEHGPAGQVVQFDPVAGPAQRTRRRDRVQGERQRTARVVRAEQMTPGLLVDDNQLGAAVAASLGAGPGARRPRRAQRARQTLVQPVDPPGHRDAVGAGRNRPLHAQRLVGRVQRRHVGLTIARARARCRADCCSSAKPWAIHPAWSRSPAAVTVRPDSGRRHQFARRCARCPRLLWAQGAPFGGGGRSR